MDYVTPSITCFDAKALRSHTTCALEQALIGIGSAIEGIVKREALQWS